MIIVHSCAELDPGKNEEMANETLSLVKVLFCSYKASAHFGGPRSLGYLSLPLYHVLPEIIEHARLKWKIFVCFPYGLPNRNRSIRTRTQEKEIGAVYFSVRPVRFLRT